VNILLLEDDLLFGESLQDFLEEEGFDVTLCRNGQEALERTFDNRYDLYLLDINVPVVNGLELLGDLRKADDDTPAIYLTSHQDKETMTKGFGRGADDYLKKPVDMDELLLRINALLRRTKGDPKRCIGTICLDESRLTITRDGEPVELTRKEYHFMALLMRNVGNIVTKEMIIESLWESSEEVSDGAVRVYITRLKNEFGEFTIENIRGIGYRLVT
jgi:DNA-binding response OmpR family regulator